MTDSRPASTLSRRMAVGAAWMILFRLVDRVLALVSTIILARLLIPDDFGIVAMATTLIALIEVLTQNDFGSSIVQDPSPTREDYDTAWSMNIALGFFAGALIAILAVPAAWFFEDQRLVPILLVLAMYPVLDGTFNIGIVDFRKHMQFDKDFVQVLSKKLAGFAACIPLAIAFRSYWALIAGMLAGRLAYTAISYYLHPFRPRWCMKSLHKIWGFSKWILINNAVTFLSQRAMHVVIGRLTGARDLGLYTVAFDFANLPTNELAVPINRVAFSGYSQIQSDEGALRSGFLRVLGMIALAAMPAGLGMAMVAPTFVPLILGPQWLETVPLIQVLGVGGAILTLQANVESVYFAKGLPKLRAQITAIQGAIMLPLSIWLVTTHGVAGASYAFLFTAVVIAAFNLWRASGLLAIPRFGVLKELWRPAVAALFMAAALVRFSAAPSPSDTIFPMTLSLLAQVALGGAIYLSTITALWVMAGRPFGAESWIIDALRRGIARSRAA